MRLLNLFTGIFIYIFFIFPISVILKILFLDLLSKKINKSKNTYWKVHNKLNDYTKSNL